MIGALPERRRLDAGALQRLEGSTHGVFARHPEVVAAYIYGSAAREKPARDLDVAVLFAGETPPGFAPTWFATALCWPGAGWDCPRPTGMPSSGSPRRTC